jgi:hypothetical protein
MSDEDFSGPIKLPTRSVFDLKLALSFNCQEGIAIFLGQPTVRELLVDLL